MGVSRQTCSIALYCVLVPSIALAGVDPPEFMFLWGSPGGGEGQFSGGHGIEVDDDGNVYVVDTGNNRVQKFNSEGEFLMTWGSFGAGDGQFNHPHGVGIGPNGHIFVAETGNNRVQKFTLDGVFVTGWGSFGNGDGQFQHSHGLAVDSKGNVYVSDRNQNRVQKFTNDGEFIMAWGTTGIGDGQFSSTNGVAIDAEDNVFVGDSSPRIQKFTSDGKFIMSWGSLGNGDGQFNFPRGLSTDEFGNVYVADRNLHRMQKFTGNGEFITIWGSFGSGEGEFNLPYAIRASGDGFVYVSDSSNNRVQKFRVILCPTTTPDSVDAFRGFYVSGTLEDVLESDDSDLCYEPGIVLFPTEAPITLDFTGTLPDDSPASLDVTIESSANTVGLELTISMWNYNTNSWDVVGTDTQSLNADTARTFAGDPADHVEPGTGEVRTRYEVRVVSFISLFPWLDCVDHVYWTTTN